jgi:hypothetical protein
MECAIKKLAENMPVERKLDNFKAISICLNARIQSYGSSDLTKGF